MAPSDPRSSTCQPFEKKVRSIPVKRKSSRAHKKVSLSEDEITSAKEICEWVTEFVTSMGFKLDIVGKKLISKKRLEPDELEYFNAVIREFRLLRKFVDGPDTSLTVDSEDEA